jgi:general secretion pathway protein C
MGTVISRKRALATFFIVPKNESDVYRVGDEVYEGWKVDAIERALVRLKSGNDTQEIALFDPENPNKPATPLATAPADSGGEAVPSVGGPSDGFAKEESDGKFIVDKAELDQQLANLDQLITQARVIPNYSQGKVDGFKIFAIKPNSVFQRLGLRNGDIISSINGAPLDNAQKGIQLFQELRNLPKFEINLMRHKTARTQTYEVR